MQYTKEHEFIVAKDENGKVCGKLNLSTGEMYGVSGKVIKHRPDCFKQNVIRKVNPNDYWGRNPIHGKRQGFWAEVAWYYFQNFNTLSIDADARAGLERIVSLGIMPDGCTMKELANIISIRLDNKFIEAYRAQYLNMCGYLYRIDDNSEHDVLRWHSSCAQKTIVSLQFKNELANLQTKEERECYHTLMEHSNLTKMPKDIALVFVRRCSQEQLLKRYKHIRDNARVIHAITQIIEDYYSKSMEMYGSCEVLPNFLTKYYELCASYDQWIDANTENILKIYNGNEKLQYRNEKFFIQCLTSHSDFHNEGTAQHNCVEHMYMEKVINKRTHVVSIRKIDYPDQSYISCEVDNNGYIQQYLGFANSRIEDKDAIQFRAEYQAYLKKQIW